MGITETGSDRSEENISAEKGRMMNNLKSFDYTSVTKTIMLAKTIKTSIFHLYIQQDILIAQETSMETAC